MDYAKFDPVITFIAATAYFLLIAGFIVLTFILDHDWRRYATSRMRLYSMRGMYLVVSGILITLMTGALLTLFS